MKAKATTARGEDGSFMRIEVMSLVKLLLASGIAVTFLALFVLLGFSSSPAVARSDWTSLPTRCTSDFSVGLLKDCLGSSSTTTIKDTDANGSVSAIDAVLSLPTSQRSTALTCMFDSCTSRTNRPFASSQQALHVVHYSFGLNGLSQRNRYFYLAATFPNLNKVARSFDVTVTPHVKGFFINETSGNQTYAEIITDVVQRTITIECEEGESYCESDYFLRFGEIDFANYQVDVLFNSTESLVLSGSNIQFRKTWGTEAFTDWLIGMKLFFLLLSILIAVWYIVSINKLSSREQNIEQGYVAVLVVALIFFNDPFYFAEATYGSNAARILSVNFQTTFFQMLLLFWMVAIDNLRLQGKESGVSNTVFFAPKIIFLSCFWLIMVFYCGYLKYYSNNDVMWNPLAGNSTFLFLKALCGLLSAIYALWYCVLIVMSLKEICRRRMRYRYLVGLSLLIMIAAFSGLASGAFSPTPSSGGAWTSMQALFNVYIFTLCYLYAPSATTLENLRKRKQNHGNVDHEAKAILGNNTVDAADVELASVDEIRETDLA